MGYYLLHMQRYTDIISLLSVRISELGVMHWDQNGDRILP